MRPLHARSIAIAGTLWLCACASSTASPSKSTLDVYSELQGIRLYSFHCVGSPPEDLEERLQRLLPWMSSVLGRDIVMQMESDLENDRGLVDLARCPTAYEMRRARADYEHRLRMLERRSR